MEEYFILFFHPNDADFVMSALQAAPRPFLSDSDEEPASKLPRLSGSGLLYCPQDQDVPPAQDQDEARLMDTSPPAADQGHAPGPTRNMVGASTGIKVRF